MMSLREAIEFALGKIENEVDREFDGADVDEAEAADYDKAIRVLDAHLTTWPECASSS